MRVILAESSPHVRELLTVCCELMQCVRSVVPVRDGVEALQHAASAGADVVVLEIDNPALAGLPILQALRRSCRTARIVTTSSAANAHLAAPAARAGSCVHLLKPFPLEEFFQAVGRGPVRLKHTPGGLGWRNPPPPVEFHLLVGRWW